MFTRQPEPDNRTLFYGPRLYIISRLFLSQIFFPFYVNEVEKTVKFILLYYYYYYYCLRSPLAASAPYMDLQYYRLVAEYMDERKLWLKQISIKLHIIQRKNS